MKNPENYSKYGRDILQRYFDLVAFAFLDSVRRCKNDEAVIALISEWADFELFGEGLTAFLNDLTSSHVDDKKRSVLKKLEMS